LSRLAATDRAILTLVDLEGYSSSEAAQILGLSRVAVRLRASRARRKLRSILGKGRRT
jgi:RNA polymerase sigma-70 factor (ECF subfamily)